VEIRVNDAGEVISARIQKGTISDNTIRNSAIEAAKKNQIFHPVKEQLPEPLHITLN